MLLANKKLVSNKVKLERRETNIKTRQQTEYESDAALRC